MKSIHNFAIRIAGGIKVQIEKKEIYLVETTLRSGTLRKFIVEAKSITSEAESFFD